MKVLLFAVVALLLVSAIFATPQTGGATTKAPAKKCEVCSTDFVPICAAPTGSKEEKDKISFGSVCVMRKYNCENNKNFVKTADGECPGKRPVRLQ